MGKHYLSSLFTPKTVAVIGASNRLESVGGLVFRNLLEGGYKGRCFPINPKHTEIQGQPAFATVEQIPERIDLAVIATKAETVPAIIEACGQQGVRAAVILSAGFHETGAHGAALEKAVLENARRYGLRLIGPNCLGVIRPEIGLNATFTNSSVKPGNLALISQSGALCSAILDWALPNDVGFSSVVSLGDSADVDFGEILDFMVSDPKTRAILLYIEGIRNARRFMSALRAAARHKPVLVVKVGRHEVGSKAAQSHTDALVVADDVFDATLRRAGAVRVLSVAQLFTSARALATGMRPSGNRLAIVTNGGGPGVMAADRAADLGVEIATLSSQSIEALNSVLPVTWSHGNPIDIIGDATAQRYRDALTICMQDKDNDGVLVILTPQAMTQPTLVAEAVIDVARQFTKPLLVSWMGGSQVMAARTAFLAAGISSFRTPEPAVEVFSYLSAYAHNQQLLLQMPGPLSHQIAPDIEGARLLIESVLAEHRKVLNEMESKALLAAFRIPVAQTVVAHSPNEALLLAEQFEFPVAMKINSPDITHKSDSGGVRLNVANAVAVRAAYQEIINEVRRNRPTAHIDGIAIEPMAVKPNGRELLVGVTTDPVFGPVITFGLGGTTVEVLMDRAVELLPLNAYLANNMIQRTRAAKLLGAFRHMPAVNMDSLVSVLLRVSEMVCELPWLKEMDINPLLVDEHGALAVDARFVVDFHQPSADRYGHMAISPYPTHLVSDWQLPDGTNIVIRPIRPEDADLEKTFVHGLSDEAKYFRFMETIQELTPAMLVRFTQIDYDQEMALMAVTEVAGQEVELGIARYAINPDGQSCEFALVVADEWQGKGVAHKLMSSLMDVARDRGLERIEGEVLRANQSMLKLMTRLGFEIKTSEDDDSIKRVSKAL
ncbi:MAG TPA: bifunctional acetate--CoA ligase family protein/GNAT family N-acetyltransferase [Gammaproteobacteria bacterium]|nr:bifunctional acetate--CoA ligase family protein/GNAT family N-acetyltransferase [Gammaproteobacteria bacterium]